MGLQTIGERPLVKGLHLIKYPGYGTIHVTPLCPLFAGFDMMEGRERWQHASYSKLRPIFIINYYNY